MAQDVDVIGNKIDVLIKTILERCDVSAKSGKQNAARLPQAKTIYEDLTVKANKQAFVLQQITENVRNIKAANSSQELALFSTRAYSLMSELEIFNTKNTFYSYFDDGYKIKDTEFNELRVLLLSYVNTIKASKDENGINVAIKK